MALVNLSRPPLRFANFQSCWQVKWKEYLSTYNTALVLFLPVMSVWTHHYPDHHYPLFPYSQPGIVWL